ncbi:MAG TPA: ATP-grasp domain-containing protein [Rhodocyclaceae bacterium]
MIFLLSPRWMGISRLPKGLIQAGFQVVTLSPVGSFLSQTRYAQHHFTMPAGASIADCLLKTIARVQPTLIVPGCDAAVAALRQFANANGAAPSGSEVANAAALIRNSLGGPTTEGMAESKHALVERARGLGLRVPQQAPVAALADTLSFAEAHGYPVVLKSDLGTGGKGVRICANPAEVEGGLKSLATDLGTAGNGNLAAAGIYVQQHIRGMQAMQSLSAMAGQILEHLTIVKEHCHPQETGPSSVVRFVEHAEIDATMQALLADLGYSGFCSADFIIEDTSQAAYLLELNQRPCPICPLGHLVGRDLNRALYCKLSGAPYQRSHPSHPVERVALFPQEWLRDQQSPLLAEIHHDVPWDDPRLLRALVNASCDHLRC